MSLSSGAIGAVLSTALLIGPAATALRIAEGPVRAMVTAAGIGVVVTWLGILLAYDSYYWPPHGHAWPVSFLSLPASSWAVFLALSITVIEGLLLSLSSLRPVHRRRLQAQ